MLSNYKRLLRQCLKLNLNKVYYNYLLLSEIRRCIQLLKQELLILLWDQVDPASRIVSCINLTESCGINFCNQSFLQSFKTFSHSNVTNMYNKLADILAVFLFSLSYLNLTVHLFKCSEEHSGMRSTFPTAILNVLVFSPSEIVLARPKLRLSKPKLG